MKKILLLSALLSSSAFCQNLDIPQHPPTALAKPADKTSIVASNDYGAVDRLCPAPTAEYGETMEKYQIVIDAINAKPVWPYSLLVGAYQELKDNMERCFVLKTLKTDYDLLLATNVLATAENKVKVQAGLDELHVCLQNAKKRSEIERCDTNFRFLISTLLDL